MGSVSRFGTIIECVRLDSVATNSQRERTWTRSGLRRGSRTDTQAPNPQKRLPLIDFLFLPYRHSSEKYRLIPTDPEQWEIREKGGQTGRPEASLAPLPDHLPQARYRQRTMVAESATMSCPNRHSSCEFIPNFTKCKKTHSFGQDTDDRARYDSS